MIPHLTQKHNHGQLIQKKVERGTTAGFAFICSMEQFATSLEMAGPFTSLEACMASLTYSTGSKIRCNETDRICCPKLPLCAIISLFSMKIFPLLFLFSKMPLWE
jgi:hypothetical protein